jgi:hypothetical protein
MFNFLLHSKLSPTIKPELQTEIMSDISYLQRPAAVILSPVNQEDSSEAGKTPTLAYHPVP